ncbi:MAG: hypothetical protein RBR30_06275 [Tenuifilaceae bacterium]|jgi:hypothetical protein|nr:hypothetical protein [Tenuifilaceae bacterium]
MIQQNNNEFDIASQPLQASRRQAGSTFPEEAVGCKSELKIASPDKERRDRNDAKMI